MTQLDIVLKYVQDRQSLLSGNIEENTASIKQVAVDTLNYLFKPVNNLLTMLITTLKQPPADHSGTNQQHGFADTLYKAIINARNSLVDDVASYMQGISKEAESGKGLATHSLSSSIKNLDTIVTTLNSTLISSLTKEAEKNPEILSREFNTSAAQVKQEIDQLIRTIQRQIDAFFSRTAKASDTMLPEGIRQQVETALNRLESLQLLAKPAPTGEGQQQILSFPMKIGDEWTDVNILLIKKRDKNKSRISSGKFAVRMYVSPSQCGPVIVNMDYQVKHKLTVRIEFENPDARAWFSKQKEQLITALQENGMGSVALSLESVSRKESIGKKGIHALPVSKGSNTSKIDISV
jgi:hypothetical protein